MVSLVDVVGRRMVFCFLCLEVSQYFCWCFNIVRDHIDISHVYIYTEQVNIEFF